MVGGGVNVLFVVKVGWVEGQKSKFGIDGGGGGGQKVCQICENSSNTPPPG